MSKILKSWVGEEELRKTAVLCVGTPWHDRKSLCGAITPELDFATGGLGQMASGRRRRSTGVLVVRPNIFAIGVVL